MKYLKNSLVLGLATLMLAACGTTTPEYQNNTNNPDLPAVDSNGKVDHTVKENTVSTDGAKLVYSAPSTLEKNIAEYHTKWTNLLVDNGAKPMEVLKLYKELIAIEAKDSPNRKKALRYLLDQNIYLIEAGKGEEALALAMELDKLIPQDFYVQNRIIGAHRVMAEAQLKAGNLTNAYQTIQKARAVRFDPEATRTYMHIQFALIEKDIAAKKYKDAALKLDDVMVIFQVDNENDSKKLFPDELKQAQKFAQEISSHLK